jgi:hypothetical protein
MGSPSEFEKALAALNAELAQNAKWSSAPHSLYAREMQGKGQLELDYQSLNEKLEDFRTVLPAAEQAKFGACVQEVTAAFGGMIIHAEYHYDDQRDVMRGWQEVWRQVDNALKGINFFVGTVSVNKKNPGRPGGAGGKRVDLFNINQDCM